MNKIYNAGESWRVNSLAIATSNITEKKENRRTIGQYSSFIKNPSNYVYVMTLDSWSFIHTLLNISSLFSNFWRITARTKNSLNIQSFKSCMYDYYECWKQLQSFGETVINFIFQNSVMNRKFLIFTNNSFSVNKDINVRIKWHQWRTWQREADQPPAAQSLRIRTDDRLQSLSHTREQSGDHRNEGQEVCASSELNRKWLYTVTPPFFLSSCPDLKAHYSQ